MFPEIKTNMVATITHDHHDKQNPQFARLITRSNRPWTCNHSITPHLVSKAKIKDARKETSNTHIQNSVIFILNQFFKKIFRMKNHFCFIFDYYKGLGITGGTL